MKKIIFTLIVALCYGSVSAQKVHFTDSTNVWHGYNWDDADVPYYSLPYTYSFSGDTIFHGTTYKKLLSDYASIVLVREDTTLKKVFIVPLAAVSYPLTSDTDEHVLYDYNLNVGDTFYYPNVIPRYVYSMDTVLINGTQHRVWFLVPVHDTVVEVNNPYYVVEGIGCLDEATFPTHPSRLEGAVTLTCFNTHDSTPPLDHMVDSYFDNSSSCSLTFGLGVATVQQKSNDAAVIPNPVNTASKVALPYAVSSGTLIVLNDIGQTVINTSFQNKDELLIGDKKYTPGIYFYRVTDITNGMVFAGKFIYK